MLKIIRKIYQIIRYGLLQRNIFYITSPLRTSPQFIVIGVGRGGTTSLFHYLSQHPCIEGSAYDELGFFDDNFHLGLNWYRSLFPTKFTKNKIEKKYGKFLTYEVTPQYIRRPWVAKRILQTFPKMKFILLLRNPIDRTLSHYYLAKRTNHKILQDKDGILSFDAIVHRDIESISRFEKGKSDLDENYFRDFIEKTFLGRGLYVQFLREWFKVYDKEHFLILSTEELANNTQNTLNKIFKFLKITEFEIPNIQKHNIGKYDPMNDDTRKKLVEFFEKYNQSLYKLLGKDFGWK